MATQSLEREISVEDSALRVCDIAARLLHVTDRRLEPRLHRAERDAHIDHLAERLIDDLQTTICGLDDTSTVSTGDHSSRQTRVSQ